MERRERVTERGRERGAAAYGGENETLSEREGEIDRERERERGGKGQQQQGLERRE